MYIYKNNGNNIEAYELIAKAQELARYRKEKLQLIPKEEQAKAAYCRGWFSRPFEKQFLNLLHGDEAYDYLRFDNPDAEFSFYHCLNNMDLNNLCIKYELKDLLEDYYNGKYSDRPIIKMQYEDIIKYYLITKDKYEKINNEALIWSMDKIIQLPKCLYLLQLLEQGKYSLIKPDDDINEQLALFDIEFIDRFSKNTLAKMDRCGITNNALEKVNTYTGNDVLKRVLK